MVVLKNRKIMSLMMALLFCLSSIYLADSVFGSSLEVENGGRR
jgi:hypothetical protein